MYFITIKFNNYLLLNLMKSSTKVITKAKAGAFILPQPHLSNLHLYFKACDIYIIETINLVNLVHSF